MRTIHIQGEPENKVRSEPRNKITSPSLCPQNSPQETAVHATPCVSSSTSLHCYQQPSCMSFLHTQFWLRPQKSKNITLGYQEVFSCWMSSTRSPVCVSTDFTITVTFPTDKAAQHLSGFTFTKTKPTIKFITAQYRHDMGSFISIIQERDA